MPRGSAVLEDPTGRRRRRLRILGRMIAFALTLWLVALVLGGVGLNPVPGIPFVRALRPATPPPVVRKLPKPKPPAVADLRLAKPAPTGTGVGSIATRSRPAARNRTAAAAPLRPHAKRRATNTTPVVSPVATGAPPGRTTPTKTAHPNNGIGSGSTSRTNTTTTTTTTTTTAPARSGSSQGRNGSAPGHTKTATTTP